MVLLSVGLISKLYMNDAEDKLTEKETTANSIVTTETYDYSYHDRQNYYQHEVGNVTDAIWVYGFLPAGDRLWKDDQMQFGNDIEEFYLHDGGEVIADYSVPEDTYTLTAAYINSGGVDGKIAKLDSGGAHYYLADGLGSVHQLHAANQNVEQTYLSDAWGNNIYDSNTVANRYQFTGRERDTESSLMYYRARMYDPKTGRFTTDDPAGMPDGMNRKLYCSNNPVNATDPSGLNLEISGVSTGEVDSPGGQYRIDYLESGITADITQKKYTRAKIAFTPDLKHFTETTKLTADCTEIAIIQAFHVESDGVVSGPSQGEISVSGWQIDREWPSTRYNRVHPYYGWDIEQITGSLDKYGNRFPQEFSGYGQQGLISPTAHISNYWLIPRGSELYPMG